MPSTTPTISINAAIAGDDTVNAAEAAAGFVISGITTNVEDGRTATIGLGNTTYTTTVANNIWSVTVPSAQAQALVDGAQTATADVFDEAGNAAPQATRALTVDETAPVVGSVTTLPATADLNAGQTVTLTLGMSEAVTVNTTGGTPTLTLNDGGTATYVSGSGTSALVFSYTVGAGQNTADLAVTGSNLNGGTVKDGAGNATNLAGAVTNPAGTLQIDTTAPTVASVTASPSTADLNAGQTVTLTLGMSEAVAVNTTGGTPTLTLNDGGTATYVSGSGTSALVFSYTVGAGQNTADLAVTGSSLNGGTVKDGAGNAANLAGAVTNPAGTLQIDTAAPNIGVIGPVAGDNIVSTVEAAAGFTVSGTTAGVEDGQVATIALVTAGGTTVDSYTPTVTGNAWSINVTAAQAQALADGAYTVRADVADRAGNPAPQATLALTVDQTAPTVVITPTTSDSVVNLAEATAGFAISGTTVGVEDGQIVTVAIVNVSNAIKNTYTAAVSGNAWTVNVTAAQAQALANGSYTIRANLSDLAGNPAAQATQSLRVDETPPTSAISNGIAGDNTVNAAEAAAGFAISGTTIGVENGQVVTITIVDALSAAVDTLNATVSNNAWSATVSAAQATALADGTYTVQANLTDSAGNPAPQVTRALRVDQTAPTIAITTPIAGDDAVNADEAGAGVTISGTTVGVENGQTATVRLYDAGNVLRNTYTTTVTGNAWSITVTPAQAIALIDGLYTAKATVSDAAGNPAVQANASFTIAETAPTIAIDVVGGDGTLNAAEAGAGFVISGTSAGAEDGQIATIDIVDGLGAAVHSYTAAIASNAWSVNVTAVDALGLADGQYTVRAAVSDAAGNPAINATRSLKVDETAPTIGIATVAGDDVVNRAEARVGFAINGTASGVGDGGMVTVSVVDGASAVVDSYIATVSAGLWSAYVTAAQARALADGSYTIQASASDLAGNPGTASLALTVDETPPSISITAITGDDIIDTSDQAGGFAINGATVGVEDGQTATITLTNASHAVGDTFTITVANNAWSVLVDSAHASALANGPYLVQADVSDTAGNPATTGVRVATVSDGSPDNSPPIVLLVSASPDDVPEGIGIGQTVALTLTMSKATTVDTTGGTPTLILDDGGTATYVSGSGSGALVFSYTVAPGENTADLTVTAGNLNGATISDGNGHLGDLSSAAGNPAGTLRIDTTAPTVASVTASPGTADLTIDGKVTLTLAMSEVVNVTGAPSLTLDDGGSATYLSGSGTDTLVFTYTVGSGEDTADLTVTGSGLNGGVIEDLAGNAADLAGAVVNPAGTLQIDTTAPSIAITSPVAGDNVVNASEAAAGFTVSGTTSGVEDGQVATISLVTSTGTPLDTYSATVIGGAWSVGVTAAQATALLNGSDRVRADVSDAAGNAATTAYRGFSVDQTAPLLAIGSGASTVNLAQANAGFTLSGSTTGVENGQSVTVTIVDGANAVVGSYTGTVANNAWSVSVGTAQARALADGSYTVKADVTDAAGNPAAEATRSLRIDETPPVLAIGAIAGDNTVNLAEATAGYAISGTIDAEDGQAISIRVFDSANVLVNTYSTTVASNAWSANVTPAQGRALVNGSYTVKVDGSDSAGNAAVQATRTLTVDETPPIIVIATPIAGDSTLNASEAASGFNVSGTTGGVEDGQVVTVSILDASSNVVGTTTATVTGNAWSATVTGATATALADGSATVRADVADLAGNPAVAATSGLTVDETAPSIAIAASIAGDNVVNASEAAAGVAISGTTSGLEDGQVATIRIVNSASVAVDTYTTLVTGGAWSINVTSAQAQALADGAYTVTADVSDVAGNPAAEATGALMVDRTAPTIPSVTASPSDDNLKAGQTVTLTLATSEAVFVTGTPKLTLNDGGTATYVSGSGGNTLVFSHTVAAGQNAADLVVNALNLNGGTIKDAAGNPANLTGANRNPPGILRIDTTAPTVSSVTASPATASLMAGSVASLTLNMSEVVTVAGGTPTLALNDGGTATYVSGSGSNALVFSYTVSAGENTPDLQVSGSSLNGAIIKDGAGNVANLAGAVTNPSGTLQIDTIAPTITSVTASPATADYRAGQTFALTVHASEAVKVVTSGGTPSLSLNNGGTATYASGSGSSALVFNYIVSAGQDVADLEVLGAALNGGTIKDLAGNDAVLDGATTDPAGTLQIDTIAPTVTGVTASPETAVLGIGRTASLTLTMSEAAFVTGAPQLTLNDGGTAIYMSGSGTNELVFSYTVGAGQGTTDLAIASSSLTGGTIGDGAGNAADLTGALVNPDGTLQIDGVAPAVSLVTASPDTADLNAGHLIILTVGLSKAVTVDTVGGVPSLALNGGGTATYQSGSGTSVLVFGYTVGAGQDTADLAVTGSSLNGGTIKDAVGNDADLTGAVFNPAGILQIDTTAPSIAFTAPLAGDGKVNAAEAGAGFSVGGTTIGVENGQTATIALLDAGGNTVQSYTATVTGNAWSISVAAADAQALLDGAYTMTAGVSDLAGNPAVGATIGLAVDTTAPVVASVTAAPDTADLTIGQSVTLTLGMSEAAVVDTVGGTPTLSLNNGGMATYVSGSGSSALVFSYMVGAGEDTADLTVTGSSLDGGGITDLAGNAADLAGAVADPAGTLQIDTTIPSITLAMPIAGDGMVNAAEAGAGFTIGGTTTGIEDGQTVTVALVDAGGNAARSYAATVTGDAWSIDITAADAQALADGIYTVTADTSDLAGNPAAPATSTLTVDETAPSIAISAPLAGDGVVNAAEAGAGFTIGGTTMGVEDGQTLSLALVDAGGNTADSYTATVAGNAWSIGVTAAQAQALLDGAYTVTASVADLAGNSAAQVIGTVDVDETLPSIAFTTPLAGDGRVNAAEAGAGFSVGGTTIGVEDGQIATIALLDAGGNTVHSYTATITGNAWSINVPAADAQALADGTYTVTAGVSDLAGNPAVGATIGLAVDATAPVVASVTAAPDTADLKAGQTVTLTLGMSEAAVVDTVGGTPTLSLNNGGMATYVSGSGTSALVFSYTVGAGEDIADLTVTGSSLDGGGITDLAGNAADLAGAVADPAGTLQIDTTAPSIAMDVPIAGDGMVNAAEAGAGFTIGGTTTGIEDDQTVTVALVDAGGNAARSYAATVTGDAWSIDITAADAQALADGIYTVTADTSDLAGNPAARATSTLTVDETAPSAPTLSESAETTAPAKPIVDGTAPLGTVVTIDADGVDVGTASVSPEGQWRFDFQTALSPGSHVLTATATDPAGNLSPQSAPLTLQVATDQGYDVTSPPDDSGKRTSRAYDSSGQLKQVDTWNANGQLLQSVTATSAILQIYDSAGTLIGTVSQPSMSPSTQPIFGTTARTLGATTMSGPIDSHISLIDEDHVLTTQAHDTVTAGAGHDTIFAAGPTTSVTGGSGALFFVGGTGASSVTGGAGTMTVFGGTGGGVIEGSAGGANVLVSGGGNTTLVGGGDGDVLVAAAGTTTVTMRGNSVAFGGTGHATIFGSGDSTLVGGSNSDVLIAGDGREALWAGSGTSELYGGAGHDTLAGGVSGQATLVGGSGDNVFAGFGGAVTAYGGTGDDLFFAGSGPMTIVEGPGSDQVVFGSGNATVTAGSGSDLFTIANGHAGGTDVINGFKVGVDRLEMFGYDQSTTRTTVEAGSTRLDLSDGTKVFLVGVTQWSS